jgi:hypothetical protein
MNPIEAAQLLTHAAAFDNRKPSAAAAQAWAAALHDVPLDDDAIAAVARYYGCDDPQATGQRWIQPHHVRTHRKAIRAERLDARPLPAPAAELTDNEAAYRDQLKRIINTVGDGRMPFQALPASGSEADEPNDEFRRVREAHQVRQAERQAAETAEQTRERLLSEAYGYLMVISQEAAARAVERAHAELGEDADRHDVVLLAARLADAKPVQPGRPDKATADLLAISGCPNGCPLGEHERSCYYASAS